MISETRNKKSHPALTSDRWHVVHARWSGNKSAPARFVRSIVSEHEDRAGAASAKRELAESMAADLADRPRACRDQIFVRKPGFKSLVSARRIERSRD